MDPIINQDDDDQFVEDANFVASIMMQGATLYSQAIQIHMENEGGEKQRRISKHRDRDEASARLQNDYFNDNPVYGDEEFRRRFRMSKRLFLRIVQHLEASTIYFTQRWDHRGRKGFSPIQKCTSAIRQLAYGTASDMFDEYLHYFL